MAYSSFEDLDVWKRSCRLAIKIYETTNSSNDLRLTSQMQGAAVSIPSNIAEGHERQSPKDFARFLRISKGSCAELRTQLYIAQKINLTPDNNFPELIQETIEISKMLQGLINSLSKTT